MIAGVNAVTDALWHLVATPVPTPTGVDANDVTPGVWGFAIIFLIAVVAVLLIIDMQRRVRRVNYRSEIDERLQAELAQSQRADGNDPAGIDDQRDSGTPDAPRR
jgi:membrane protein YdbS with pleckstrin-like domain